MYQKADTRFGKIIKLCLMRALLRRGGGAIAALSRHHRGISQVHQPSRRLKMAPGL
jgi:hypothetical protein